jgi:hypothetical protein
MAATHYHYHQPHPAQMQGYGPPMPGYLPYSPTSVPDPRLPPSMSFTHAAPNNKRLAPPHAAQSPAKKKLSKWTSDEDAAIIELRGNGMKWEDISREVPGRSAISCRLRFQNYLERRSEWDEEMKNKLARLYIRFVPCAVANIGDLANMTALRFQGEMWEKISKELALPWRAVEAMHWQLGEHDIAKRANVPVFHLAGQSTSSSGAVTDDLGSTSPASLSGSIGRSPMGPYPYTHNHPLPQLGQAYPPPISPDQLRMIRSDGGGSSPADVALSRHRADSGRFGPGPTSASSHRVPTLPPLIGIPVTQAKYTLPPVVTSAEAAGR